MKYPEEYSLRQVAEAANRSSTFTQAESGKWVPARPLGYPSFRRRVKLAWKVFTGRADIFTWPEGQ